MSFELPSLHDLDWEDPVAVADGAERAFDLLTADRWEALIERVDALPATERLAQMCEQNHFVKKLVVHDAPDHGYRIRAHLFRGSHTDRPHNHRWSFASMILAGRYRHTQYRADGVFEEIDPSQLQVVSTRTERVGDWYSLHHTAIHSVSAELGTFSLVLRGPAIRDSFRIIGTGRNSSYTVRAAEQESAEERAMKVMSKGQLDQALGEVRALRPQ
ncbi:hypothetical protein [Streptomyces osmaniensis]|uniref:Cysteine dioxygenase type I n=1 Tax=Streptomyces osmaniensis TaxID=593134 RepID=A0ABP6XQB3_9ACTN|nr:hypothetical protein KJK32_23690 [Streptomyces sp. JCM17656]